MDWTRQPFGCEFRKPPQSLPGRYAYIRVYPYIMYSLQDIIITTTLGHLVTPWERRGLPVCASNKMYNKCIYCICVCTPLVFAPIVRVLYCVVILLLYIIWPPPQITIIAHLLQPNTLSSVVVVVPLPCYYRLRALPVERLSKKKKRT